jgi:signal transduction histidine kinase
MKMRRVQTGKDNRRWKDYFMFACLIVISILIYCFINNLGGTSKIVGQQAPGILQLKDWNYQKSGTVSLNGKWDFYWNRLYTPEKLDDPSIHPDAVVNVPDVWTNYQIGDKKLPGFGYATYRLTVNTDSPNEALALRVMTMSAAYRLYVDGALMISRGHVGVDAGSTIPEYLPAEVSFTPKADSFDIVVQVSNYTYTKGGIWYGIQIGSPEQIARVNDDVNFRDLFLCGGLLVMAIYFINFFLIRRKNKSSLLFASICLLSIIRIIIYGNYFIYRLFPSISYSTIIFLDYASLYWEPVLFFLLVSYVFPGEIPKIWTRISIGIATAQTVFTLIAPVYLYTFIVPADEAVIMFNVLASVFVSIKALMHKKSNSLIMLTCCTLGILSAAHDILYQSNILKNVSSEMAPAAFLIVILLQSFILTREFNEAYRQSEILSDRLFHSLNQEKELSEKLLVLDRQKDEFLANTSHELRTPLNGMINIAYGLSRDTSSDEQKQNLAMIVSNAKRLSNMVNDLLDYSKLKNHGIQLQFEAIDVRKSVDTVMAVLRQPHSKSAVELINEIPGDLPLVKADKGRLIQILYNLIGNAIKFTEAGYIKASACVRENMIEICIEDTGIGIPPDKKVSIFQSFEQGDASVSRRYGGTGLGLSITKMLVEMHTGTIRAESPTGYGSKFYFTLPVSTQKYASLEHVEPLIEMQPPNEETPQFPLKICQDGPHILVVDDELANIYAAMAVLKQDGYSVTAVATAEDAIDIINTDKSVALALLDVMMPGMSGYDLAVEIRKRRTLADLPILMLTAKNTMFDIVSGFNAGANDFLDKPYEPQELLARVKTLVKLKISVDQALNAELKFLQSQIRPHFIHNSLNTIISLSITDPDTSRKLLVEFSNYLRSCFDFKNLEAEIPAERELDFVRSYLTIEQARFGDSLHVSYDIDDMGLMIPPLILQPLVENAVVHGIRPKAKAGSVVVYIKLNGDRVKIGVKDDGVGIADEKIDALLTSKLNSRGVGIFNINQRLNKIYGTSLHIENIKTGGTNVYMELPRKGECGND